MIDGIRDRLGLGSVWIGLGIGAPKHGWCFFGLTSLPELVDFKLFGKTILVVNKKFKLFLASQLGK